MRIGDILIAKNIHWEEIESLRVNDIETRVFLDNFSIKDERYFVKKITNDRVYISSYKNVHINGIFDLDESSDFYWRNFFTTQSDIRDEKLNKLGI